MGRLFLRERYAKAAIDRNLKDLQGKPRIFDAGFGFGQYSYYISRRFPSAHITGVEIAPELIEDFSDFLRRKRIEGITLERADLTGIEYKNAFDFAFSIDVMEHIENDAAVFSNLYRSLTEGGVFYMTTPHAPEGVHPQGGAFVGEHVRDGYSIAEIERKLTEAGFSRVKVDLTYGVYGSLAWKLLQKYPMLMLKASKLFLALLPLYFALVYIPAELLMYLDIKSNNRNGTGLSVTAWK